MMWAAPAIGQIVESEGYASWYNRGAHGDETASGEYYDHSAMTAAHEFLPFDSMVRVTRLDTGRSVVVRINDRMAPGPGHVIDLSGAAASRLGLQDVNVARVRIELEEPLDLLDVPVRYADRTLPEENRTTPRSDRARDVVEIRAPDRDDSQPKSDEKAQSARFTLQVGVFSSRPAASTFAGSIDHAWVLEVDDAGQTLYRVYYDRFSQEQPARVAQQSLRARGVDSFLREIL
jgi:rare lipoprotein A